MWSDVCVPEHYIAVPVPEVLPTSQKVQMRFRPHSHEETVVKAVTYELTIWFDGSHFRLIAYSRCR